MINFSLNTCWRLIPTTKGLVNTREVANQSLPFFICFFNFNTRRTLWSMRCSVSLPSSTALTTASKASTKFCGPSTMSAPAWSVPTAASALVYCLVMAPISIASVMMMFW